MDKFHCMLYFTTALHWEPLVFKLVPSVWTQLIKQNIKPDVRCEGRLRKEEVKMKGCDVPCKKGDVGAQEARSLAAPDCLLCLWKTQKELFLTAPRCQPERRGRRVEGHHHSLAPPLCVLFSTDRVTRPSGFWRSRRDRGREVQACVQHQVSASLLCWEQLWYSLINFLLGYDLSHTPGAPLLFTVCHRLSFRAIFYIYMWQDKTSFEVGWGRKRFLDFYLWHFLPERYLKNSVLVLRKLPVFHAFSLTFICDPFNILSERREIWKFAFFLKLFRRSWLKGAAVLKAKWGGPGEASFQAARFNIDIVQESDISQKMPIELCSTPQYRTSNESMYSWVQMFGLPT